MKKIVIEPNQANSYLCLEDVLYENGFEDYLLDSVYQIKLYKKGDKIYKVLKWEHFNTTVYSVVLLECDNDDEIESYINKHQKAL